MQNTFCVKCQDSKVHLLLWPTGRCILEVASDSGRLFDVILWHIFLKHTHSSVPRPRETCNKIATGRKGQNDLIAASWVEFNWGSDFSAGDVQRSLFYTPLGRPETLATHDQKYATGISELLCFTRQRLVVLPNGYGTEIVHSGTSKQTNKKTSHTQKPQQIRTCKIL